MKKMVDGRGLSHPESVVLIRKALAENEVKQVLAIVDDETVLSGVSQLAEIMNLATSVDYRSGEYYINMIKSEDKADLKIDEVFTGNTVVLISSNIMGHGEEELGQILMKNFIYTLSQITGAIKSVIFINSGVFLTTEGSELLEHIKALVDRGVEVLSCSTCLDYYGLGDKLIVGNLTNMFTITERLVQSPRVISL